MHGRLADALREHARNVKLGKRLFKVGDASKFGSMIRQEVMDPLRLAKAPILAPAHSFRHAFITETRSIAGGADVKHYLTGHANGGGSEQDIYGEQGLRVVRQFIDRMRDGVAV